MDDLIARAKKYARGAGMTQEGQRRAAERVDRLSRWLRWGSTGLSAIVGTSIFADWVGNYPVPFGLAAIAAAALTAVHGTSKLEERAEDHRLAAAEYGGLRRQADMLRLRLEGDDVKSRDEGLAELEQIAEKMTALAKKSRTVPDRIYKPAAKAFEQGHRDYYTDSPTHAGGVVFRKNGGTIQYLIVRAKNEPHDWVLPKGHIEQGETLEHAARREVLEESGVDTVVRGDLKTVHFSAPAGPVNGRFFLMEAIREGEPQEGRERKWLHFDEAIQELPFEEAKELVCRAHALILSDLLPMGRETDGP